MPSSLLCNCFLHDICSFIVTLWLKHPYGNVDNMVVMKIHLKKVLDSERHFPQKQFYTTFIRWSTKMDCTAHFEMKLLKWFWRVAVLTFAPSVGTSVSSSIHPSISPPPPPPPFHLFLTHLCFLPQFDHSFVEVHRVRKFCFQPRHHELVSLEDLSESPKKTGFSPICSAQTTCNYSTSHSSWNCDGEILPHTAIQVRYHRVTCECTIQLQT